jgi:TonB family protein
MTASLFPSFRRRILKCPCFLHIAAFLALILAVNCLAIAQNATTSHRKVLTRIEPEYPAVLKNGRFEGQVRLEVTILANGNVSGVQVKGGNPILSQYASQAVAKWKYAPGPAQTVEEVVFNFNPNTWAQFH